MNARFSPSVAAGIMPAPPSKSMGHRLLICAGLSRGTSRIRGIAPSQDMLATLDCLKALGAQYTWEDDVITIQGANPLTALSGTALPCRESGSTLRFFTPLCLLSGSEITLKGTEKLLSRPQTVYETICKERGLTFNLENTALTVQGPLPSGTYRVAGNVSSQFISGLLFALPLLPGDSRIELIPPVESRPYIDMTLEALNAFGITVTQPDELTLCIPGCQSYTPQDAAVEGDCSNAAFFDALNIPALGGSVTVTGLRPDTLQGDSIYMEHLQALAKGNTVIDLSNCPDLGPILMACAAAESGATFTGTRRLKDKESDRGQAMAQELQKLGVVIDVQENEIVVPGGCLTCPTEILSGHNDHRIVMALSTLLTKTGGEIAGAQAVRKSLPDYFDRLQTLGIEVTIDGMDQ